MSLTKAEIREILSMAGVDADHLPDATNKIADGHAASIAALREKVSDLEESERKYKLEAEKLPGVQQQLDNLKKAAENASSDGAEYKAKYEAEVEAKRSLKKEFDDYKAEQAAKDAQVKREAAAKAYFKGKKITKDSDLEIVMRGSRDEISALELDDDGKIKDAKPLDALIEGVYSKFVAMEGERGAETPNPPANTGGGMTREQIEQIKDANERQQAIADNHELFGF